MSPQPGTDPQASETSRPSGLANVFRGLAGNKSPRFPPTSSSSSSVALPIADLVNVGHTNSRGSLGGPEGLLQSLKHGTPNERISAAQALKSSIAEYPLNPVLDIWYAARDLIEPGKTSTTRAVGWELLTECVRHGGATDLERKEYFMTLSGNADPEDFDLQLSAMIELSNRGRDLNGFDYDLLPLLTNWIYDTYKSVRVARKNVPQSMRQKGVAKSKVPQSDDEKNLSRLFSFCNDVIKFSSNNANDAALTGLINALIAICTSTTVEEDLRACIGIIDAIVTFGSIPDDKLKSCVRVLSSIYCLVSGLQKTSWRTLAHLCKSHNGQATLRILLDSLRGLSPDPHANKESVRETRGSIAVLEKLLSKTSEKGYPTVPFAVLVDGLMKATVGTTSTRVCVNVLSLINSLFCDEDHEVHQILQEEDWSLLLDVAVECSKRHSNGGQTNTATHSKGEQFDDQFNQEMVNLISRLNHLLRHKSDAVPRQIVVKFFIDVHTLLPDAAAQAVLEYFQEFRCCSPSDLQWESNLTLVLDAFFSNRTRSSATRLSALQTTMDAYGIVDLVGDDAEQNFVPTLARRILQDISEETDIPVLEAIMALMVSVATSCDMELFHFIVKTVKVIVINHEIVSPIASSSEQGFSSPIEAPKRTEQTPANIATRTLVKIMLHLLNTDSSKSLVLYETLVQIARTDSCEIDARLSSMKLLFRLRADWAERIFVTANFETTFLATHLGRTEPAHTAKPADEWSSNLRAARGEHASGTRALRGTSVSHGSAHEKAPANRIPSGAKGQSTYGRSLWKVPDDDALPAVAPVRISPVLFANSPDSQTVAGTDEDQMAETKLRFLNISSWLDTILGILQGCDWEVYSFVLVHLPSQLSNHAIFRVAIPQIRELRRVICEQIRTNTFQEPPNATGLRRADVAICLFHCLTVILSYHEYFQKGEEDEIVRTFVHGISAVERTAKCCIHALSICCHELPLSVSKFLVQMVNAMSSIISQPHVSVHILEFLACLSRLPAIYVNFGEEEYKIVFAVCFRYLDYAREKRASTRSSLASDVGTTQGATGHSADSSNTSPTDELPQYVYSLAYHVILFWFLALKLPDRASYVEGIAKRLFGGVDGPGQVADEYALTTIDFMQRVTYADVNESAEDPYFTEDRYGPISKKWWLVGNSIMVIKQATESGIAEVVKRQASGTSAYKVQELFQPLPPHQIRTVADTSREGQAPKVTLTASHYMVQLMSPIPQAPDGGRPVALPWDEDTERAIRVFDLNSTVDGHKAGVIYIGEGQTEEIEILANVSGSKDYTQFLNNLGTLTRLKGANFNTQGLDRETDRDGQYTFCWRDRVTEMTFHVITQMPTDLERDPQCILKKQHIGNDFVNIVFNDSGLPFKFDTFPSQFNYVYIVITPASRASFIANKEQESDYTARQPFYRVQVISKPGFPEISPASEPKMVSLKALPDFVRLVSLNASVFCHVWKSRQGGEHVSSWRSRLRAIRRLREKHTSARHSQGPSPSPPPGSGHNTTVASLGPSHQQFDVSRPSSSVRDSFTSLRRTSVATFFTSASEQASHRSSTLSSATFNDGETGAPAGLDSLMESVDFSKWG